jgi:prepilin-type N-terminal cleavage/methylation domain-containing protein
MFKKGFTLVELLLGVVILSIIAGLATFSGVMVINKMNENSATILLYNLKADSERIASRRNYSPGEESLLSFPAIFEEYLSKSKIKNLTLTTGESTNKDTVSISLVDSKKAVYAIKVNNKCIIMLHTLSEDDNWAISSGQCIASNFSTISSWSKDKNNPIVL